MHAGVGQMRVKAIFTLLSVGLAALLLAGCGKPRYMINGLRLPPGAVEVECRKLDLPGTQGISCTFNLDSDWDEVVAHFDRILKRVGYVETGPGGISGLTAAEQRPLSKEAVRYYAKPGSDCMVQVINYVELFKGLKALDDSSAKMPDQDVSKQGEFGLLVMKTNVGKV